MIDACQLSKSESETGPSSSTGLSASVEDWFVSSCSNRLVSLAGMVWTGGWIVG